LEADFGDADGNPFDEECAKELRKLAFDNAVSLQEVTEAAKNFMLEKPFHSDHIYEQGHEVRKFFGEKLG
jgi:hypothetical protein